jgi:hypothetical protein
MADTLTPERAGERLRELSADVRAVVVLGGDGNVLAGVPEVARAAAALALPPAGEDPWERRDGWRLGGERAPSYWKLSVDGGEPFDIVLHDTRVFSRFVAAGDWIGYEGWAWRVTEATAEDVHHAHADGELRAPMPGAVLLTPKGVGDTVQAGQTVVVLESMKMELALAAPVDGTVTELRVSVGDKVGRDEVVAKVEAA